ncbi:Suf-domain-containing protein [Pholiota conissans]|uniref:mRNA 3'-end-processing protein RNA14 n=1 Tax=Pholiota conissans TaxID=109636 RepID=A0A9P5YU22_9AGAR|nr:Suf-domain-containing protein [Pholiota conissans]
MSASEFATADDDSYMDFAGDRTLPTSEILSALSPMKEAEDDPPTGQQAPGGAAQPPAPPPTSEYDALTTQLAENPHNPDGWRRLIRVAEDSGDMGKISAAYDALLKQFPNNAAAQIQYISHFVNDESTFEHAEELFKKFLIRSPCVELWVFYLTYVRRLNVSAAQRDNIRMSYEFALNHVGQDKDSGQIWSDYIQFLKSGEATTTWEQQQKMDSLRKVYHRAVQIPLDNVERLWQELEAFETGLNKITAKKFMADLSPAHMQARTVLRQLVNHVTPLYAQPGGVSSGAEMYLPSMPRFDASERALVGKWKAYLKWEESNPLEIEEKDKATLITRIQGVYRKAVIRMRYYTEIWFMAYTWTNSVGKTDEAMSILKAGLEANPSSFLLTFAYTEALEIKKEFAEVHATYEKFLAILRTNLEALEQQTGDTSMGSAVPTSGNGQANTSNDANVNSQSSFGTQSDDRPKQTTELQRHRTEYGLVWIMYMRFAMRAEGVKPSRAVFGKARRDRWTPWEVFEASALMEYHCSDDKAVASRIFEKGLDVYGDEIEYVLRYLGFLISINDNNNARALFERVINNFSPERARPLWERWARYEYQYGDLDAALKLEKRMAEVYVSDPPIKRLAQRHMYLGTDAIADRDLGFAYARRGPGASGGIGRTETSNSLLPNSQTSNAPPPTTQHKRGASPDYPRKREEGRGGGGGGGDYSSGHKRARPQSPAPRSGTDRDRDSRWDGPSRRRFSPQPPAQWDRDDRGPGGSGRGGREPPASRERDEDKPRPAQLPGILSWFIGELPTPSSFDGPVFRTDDLMNLFRNAVIPSTSARPKSPALPPPRSAGRPPPDYGPYQGPNSGRGRRGY